MIFKEYPFIEAAYYSGRRVREPEILVLHYTAGRGDAKRLGRFFAGGSRKASAHFGIGRFLEEFDGGIETNIAQYVDTAKNAWHPGKSRFKDGKGYIGWRSIGIEICNTGWGHLSRFGPDEQDRIYHGPHRLGKGVPEKWEVFQDIQYGALIELLPKLKKAHPTLKYITGHEDIRNKYVVDIKGSKSDPGPAFNWKILESTLKDLDIEEWHFSFRDHKWYQGLAEH
jgi:N-acetyl-anhydromuramyl-L-alanine amidase AmpD